jgi:hypothetical protein
MSSYNDGTISIANGSTDVVGTGTAFSTTAKRWDLIVHVPDDAAQAVVGFVDAVGGDLAIAVADAYNGPTLTDEPYRIVHGIGWLSGAAPNETLVDFLTRLKTLGLVGSGSGPPDPAVGTENEFYVNRVNGALYQRRGGVWHLVFTVGLTHTPAGAWVGDPVSKTALAIVTGDVAVDFDAGADDLDGRKHFVLAFDGDFEL